MNTTVKQFLMMVVLMMVVAVFLGAGALTFVPTTTYETAGGGAGERAIACTVNTVAPVSVGTTSVTVLSAHSGRAWAQVQVPKNASSTYFIHFDEGAAATANAGLALNSNILNGATSSPQFVVFGRNTDFPYTGAVTAIVGTNEANNASTTLLVTECRY